MAKREDASAAVTEFGPEPEVACAIAAAAAAAAAAKAAFASPFPPFSTLAKRFERKYWLFAKAWIVARGLLLWLLFESLTLVA